MLSKEEQKEKNTEFWTLFKSKMKGVPSSTGRKVNWVNYPTEVKDIYLRMEVDGKGARLCFDIQPKDDGIRSILWEQMTELKMVLRNEMEMEADWNEESHHLSGRLVSRIQWEDETLNYYKDEDIGKILEFLKNKLVRFDRFYQEYKEILINLAS